MNLNFRFCNCMWMTFDRRPGRPQEWALDEEITEVYRLATDLRARYPTSHWSDIKGLLKTRLEEKGRTEIVQKLDKIIGLMKQVIPLPPRCICGRRVYAFTYNKVENENEHYWEVFARCTNRSCRYLRRYLPHATYKWSRPKSLVKEMAKVPTFYEMDGQQVEDARR